MELSEFIEKAKKGSPVGTEKTWGGKVYIKTDSGWKLKKKGKKSAEEETEKHNDSVTENPTKQNAKTSMETFASSATNKQLEGAINDPDADPELKKIAQKELDKRNSESKTSSDKPVENEEEKKVGKDSFEEKLNQFHQEITSEIDKKLSDMTGFKKITQTYVKQDGKTVVIKMKGDNQYKATSPGFKMESKPYEALDEFKKKIKEALSSNKDENKKESSSEKKAKKEESIPSTKSRRELNFKNEQEYQEFLLERNQLTKAFDSEEREKILKIVKPWKSVYTGEENRYVEVAIESKNFDQVLYEYGEGRDSERKSLNKALIEHNLSPIANGLIYRSYEGETYKYFNEHNGLEEVNEVNDFYKKDEKKVTEDLSSDEKISLSAYTGSGYSSIRDYMTKGYEATRNIWGESETKQAKQRTEDIRKAIDRNRLSENIVLNRRMELGGNKNAFNEWFGSEVGDIIEDKSFASFSLEHMVYFGNSIHITLLGKKGDPIMNARNSIEKEYIVQAGSKYKVIAKGTNSLVVQLI